MWERLGLMAQAGWWSFVHCKQKFADKGKFARLGLKPAASFVKMTLLGSHTLHQKG